ncbi:FecR domain-containing protein [Niabella yanshanensis]|uniref:FecR domain-containing protein n=1 Tax=Niabella yanshanensis TaxID=577386 RepID=A0ABZ0WAZ3_9BACT|nr:FecR domain-containing protein [Niabella yanshanensis]WQD39251.1 FecR domain-containing protein [Niabella yanshanensis]
MIKKQSGETTLEEQLELSDLTKNSEYSGLLVEGMNEVLNSSLSYPSETRGGSVNKALDKIRERIKTSEPVPLAAKSRPVRVYLAVAASVILVLGCTFFYWMQSGVPAGHAANIVVTKKGSKTNLVLPDGTKVWINADSRLSYDKEFGINRREVYLTGEAYFDVVKDKKRPFIVHTDNIEVKVLGTAFNVRAYDDEKNIQTTLLRGSIEVLLKDNNKTLLLAPNEKMIVRNTAAQSHLKKMPEGGLPEIELLKLAPRKIDSLSVETEWTHNRLVFEQEKLTDIIPVLERWYNITIELKNKQDAGVLYRGKFENDSLEDVLESLKMIGNFSYTIQKDKVVIY